MSPGASAALLAAALLSCRDGAEPRAARPRVNEPAAALARVQHADLCVTHGAVSAAADGAGVAIREPAVRAVAPGSSGDAAELRFVYRGPTEQLEALGSGAVRRQLGLKLRAGDGCNLVYVMWRLEPLAELVVSVKRNPGQRTHRECGNRGYRNVRARRTAKLPVPPLEPGASHALRAELRGDELAVYVDGVVVWQGNLGAGVAGLRGLAGLRTDNVALDAELLAAPASGTAAITASCTGVDAE